MKYRFLTFFIFLSSYCFAQSNVVTDFKENHETALSLYFYPSTLRMINIERNLEFDEMIREIKKARFFKMDSGAVSKADLSKLAKDLTNIGFEEVMFIKDKDTDIRVWGKEKRNPELVIISKSDEELMLLEINGMINIAKIPKLTQTFNQSGFLDVLNLTGEKKKK
ncbi:MAG: DUF4252 domain-containing protein [Cyclobacteriaceae bacterium]|nr:DUF4252 domain-containing protein [Cyclobacteriaceae bacterium]MCK5209206.1 DUF4252 domain-containing protein [Cyclobacteriaceae bacterium]MCK5280071.1 DUF4252 domain-containing protein [Cyclobacteriaceae bacterium]MCK5369416.1 DUF4252 domain-containing protein [Cyclobacteriaceae bacterium]